MNQKTGLVILFLILALNPRQTSAQTTIFTHHGDLGVAVSGNNFEFEFKLFDTPTVGTGTQQGATFSLGNVSVSNGAFIATGINFGSAVFSGAERFLETWWRDGSVGGAYTLLSSRERITAVYANHSLSAATADTATNATQLGNLPPSGFIQNTTSQQSATNFNITGNGVAASLSANVVNADTQFNLSAVRVLSAPRANLFIGFDSGASNPTGLQNVFVGSSAGFRNSSGWANSFLGYNVGLSNESGTSNSFFGSYSGYSNVTGGYNSFFGESAGFRNTAGGNSFFGAGAGFQNENGAGNSFFGLTTGGSNRSGSYNSYFGFNTSLNVAQGDSNTFIGASSGNGPVTSNNNTLLGSATGLSNGITNATAIGSNAFAGQSDSLVLGGIAGIHTASRDTKVGIGTTTPSYRLHVVDRLNLGLRVQTNTAGGTLASFGGNGDFQIDAPGIVGGRLAVTQAGNTGIGLAAPNARLHVRANSGNVLIGDPGCNSGFGGIGFGASMSGCTNYSLLGEGVNTYINRPTGGSILFREGNVTQMSINVGGTVSINLLTGGGTTQLCRNPANQISVCSSSLRYKTDVAEFAGGLNVISRLQPITFNWKATGEADLGLGAEDVAKVEPLLVTHNEKGETEGVKYDRIAVVLLNAVKEQQEQIRQQQNEIETLKRIVCLDHANHAMCKGK